MSDEKPVHVGRSSYPDLIYPSSVTASSPEYREEDSTHLLDYWRVVLARRWTVLAVLLTAIAITMIWTLKQDPQYQAHVMVQIDRENPNVLTFKDVYQVESADDDALRTQFEVLKSRTLAKRVIEDLHLAANQEFQEKDPGFLGSYVKTLRESVIPSTKSQPTEQDRLKKVVDAYLERLQVAPVRNARLVNVSFESKDPKLAAQILNAHTKHFIEQNFQYKWEATNQASDFLKQQLDSLKANLEKAEDRLQEYSRDNQILFTDQGRNTAAEKLQQLEEEYTKALSDRVQKESFDRIIRAGNTDALPQLMNNQLLASLMNQLTQLQREESELAVTFSPDYPSRKRKRTQIEETEKAITNERERIVRTVQAEYTAAIEREGLLAKTLEQQKSEVERVNFDIIQYNIIKREVDSRKQLYEGLLTRLNEAGVSADLRASNIRIVDSAEVPELPVSPRKSLNLALSVVFGLLAGVGLAFFQEYMDDTIKTPDDINRHLGQPTLGLIPKMASLSTKHGAGYGLYGSKSRTRQIALPTGEPHVDIIAHDAPSSLMAEAYRSLRTSLLLSFPDTPPKTILVSSAAPSEGKTVTAVNTAISLTQMGARVVLIDADMRKPRVTSVFELKTSIGLSSVLTGAGELRTAIQETKIPNLFVIPCGPVPPNPGELIVANRFKQLLNVLPQFFDFIVLDSPPICNVSDARILAASCDATILVVKALSTSRRQASEAVDYLQESRAKLAGIVLNDLDVRSTGSYYSYYYAKYAYSYSEEHSNSA
jgi:capsular exopolysaccharide synthesis family protein